MSSYQFLTPKRLLVFAALISLPLPGYSDEVFDYQILPQEGERFIDSQFSVWVPKSSEPIQAVIVHQHGCTNASPDSHPPVTLDPHWRALARKHRCALLSPQYFVEKKCSDWNDPESGSERALFDVLQRVAKESDHSEIADVPWIFWGHSGGSSWSSQMILRHPDRVLAASFRGGCHRQFGDPDFREQFLPVALDIPLLFVWGKRETNPESFHFVSWNPMNTMLNELRATGGKVTRLIDPESEHGCDNSRLFVIPFFDAVLSREWDDVYADKESLTKRSDTDVARTDPDAVWLPNPFLFALWQHYSKTGILPKIDPPAEGPSLKREEDPNGSTSLAWQVIPEIVGGLRVYRIYRNDKVWKDIGVEPAAKVATSRDATPEELRQQSIIVDPGSYSLRYLDALGNESPPSNEVVVPSSTEN